MSDERRERSILFFGPVRRPSGTGADTRISLSDSSTAADLLEALGYDAEERPRLRVMDGGRALKSTETLGAVLELTVFLPLGGG